MNTLVAPGEILDLCIMFINKTLSSSPPMDVGQVWAEPR